MNITLRSKVHADLKTVHNRFDADLFRYLLPPGAQLIAFGGSKKGDIVHLKLPLAGEWISEITEDNKENQEETFQAIREPGIRKGPLKGTKGFFPLLLLFCVVLTIFYLNYYLG